MRDAQFRFPIDVHTGWVDFSPALRYHASEQARARLAGYASQIRSVSIRISDETPDDITGRRCEVQVSTTDAGPVTASATGEDLFAIVNHGLESVVERLHQRAGAAC